MTHQTATRQTASRRRAGLLTAALLAGLCAGLGTAQSQPAGPPPAAAASPAKAKHMPWGDPDVTGVWLYVYDGTMSPLAVADIVHGADKACLNVGGVADQLPPEFTKWNGSMVRGGTADGDVPYQPWAKTLRAKRLAHAKNPPSEDYLSTSARCLLYGVPSAMLRANPHVYQFPDHILMIWEYPQMHRIIWTDGRSPPPAQVKLWQGFSVGHWDGDTLVVTTTNLTGFPWLDGAANIQSDDAKTTEYIKVGPSNIAYKVVLDDPTAYTQSWWMEWKFTVYTPGTMPAMPPGMMPPGAKPPGAPQSAQLPPGFGPPGAPPHRPGEGTTSIGLPLDINTLNAMMIGNGEVLEVACVEGDRSHTLERFRDLPHTKANR